MRLPWRRDRQSEIREEAPERREESATTYTQLVARLIRAQADGQTVQATATAAVEAAAGALQRAFAGAKVRAPEYIREAVTPRVLAQIGRDLIRTGESLHALRMDGMGRVRLIPCSTWYWEGGADPLDWIATCTAYGPSGSTTWRLPESSVVFASWGSPTARPYHGLPPTGWAAETARLSAAAEKSLANEAASPLANLIPVPADGGDGSEDDPLKDLKEDIEAATGDALLLETVSAGWGKGAGGAPLGDWKPHRLGPAPPAPMAELRRDAFDAVLAACGTPPSLFRGNEDGTAQREGLRRWHLGTVLPLARMLEHELSVKFGEAVTLEFDTYPLDIAGRAGAFHKLTMGEVPRDEALRIVGLLFGDTED